MKNRIKNKNLNRYYINLHLSSTQITEMLNNVKSKVTKFCNVCVWRRYFTIVVKDWDEYEYEPWLSTPMVSSKVIALILRDARMASLSARVGSSLLGTLADRIQHMSHKFTLTARRSALLNGEPCRNTDI